MPICLAFSRRSIAVAAGIVTQLHHILVGIFRFPGTHPSTAEPGTSDGAAEVASEPAVEVEAVAAAPVVAEVAVVPAVNVEGALLPKPLKPPNPPWKPRPMLPKPSLPRS